MGTQRGKMKEVLSLLVRWACVVQVQDIFVVPWLLYSDQYKIFFSSTVHYFNSYFPIAQQAGQVGTQPCWVACLLVCVSSQQCPTELLLCVTHWLQLQTSWLRKQTEKDEPYESL
jgi:hypothetical protein